MNFKRDKPEHRLILGTILIVAALIFAYLAITSAKRGVAICIVVSGAMLSYGGYIVLTLSSYKERYFPNRFTAEPVAPDGSEPEDNSEELQKQIEEEKAKDTPTELKLKVLFAITIMASIVVVSILEKAYMFLPATGVVFISLIRYLREFSPRARILADKISVYTSIYLIFVTLPLIIIVYIYIDESFELVLVLLVISFMAAMLLVDTINRRNKNKL